MSQSEKSEWKASCCSTVAEDDNALCRVFVAIAKTRGVMGRERGGTASPTFFVRGTRPPLPHFFGLKFLQKLVHCCNWLLTETR